MDPARPICRSPCFGVEPDDAEPAVERTLRAVAHAGTWAEQRAG